MALQWITGEISRIEDTAPLIKQFWIKLPEKESFDFTPGQFVTLELPIHEKKNKRWRSYSIASCPDGKNEFELIIVLVSDGLGTNYLFKEACLGTQFPLSGPLGKFVLPEKIERDICFICTGTGIAPFRSMVLDIINKKKEVKNIYLLFGTRTEKDLLYNQELQKLSEEHPYFKFIPTLSRETTPEWKGKKGYVHSIYEELFADKRPADFYLCGWKNMVEEAKERLGKMGYGKESVHIELYG